MDKTQWGDTMRQTISDDAIGELMLAKSALEDHAEQVYKLQQETVALRRENVMLKTEKLELEQALERLREEVDQRGMQKLLKDLLQILSLHEKRFDPAQRQLDVEDSMLRRKILKLLEAEYGITPISGESKSVDPSLHQVIEVTRDPEGRSKVIPISSGYRRGAQVLRPAKVKVIQGSD